MPRASKLDGYLPNGQGGIQIFFEPCKSKDKLQHNLVLSTGLIKIDPFALMKG